MCWFDTCIHCEMMTTIGLINTSIASQSLFLCACDENALDLLSVNLKYIMHYYFILYCTTEYYSTMRKKEVLPFATTWMNWKKIKIKQNKAIKLNWERHTMWTHFYIKYKFKKLNLQKQSRMVITRGWMMKETGDARILYFLYLKCFYYINF